LSTASAIPDGRLHNVQLPEPEVSQFANTTQHGNLTSSIPPVPIMAGIEKNE
jgi:hypothetical protein